MNSILTASVTVIIPAYNAENTIISALKSLFEQTVKPEKIIVIDDGSSDSTKQTVTDFAAENKEIEIEVITQKNAGASAARNNGIKRVNTAYTAFLDSDDAWHPEKLEKQLKAFTDYPKAVLVSTSSTVKNSFSNTTKIVPYTKLLIKNHVITSSVLVKTGIIKPILFNEKLKRAEDYNLWLKIARDNQIVFIDEKLVFFAPKRTFGASGLSADFHALTLDEIRGFLQLFSQGFINFGQLCIALASTCLKYIRKCIIVYLT